MVFPFETDAVLLMARTADGDTLGTVTVKRGPARVAEFARLFVHESHRTHGIGRALLQRAAQVALAAECQSLSCSVHPQNHAARAFYIRLGFSVAFQFGAGDLLMTIPVARLAPKLTEEVMS